LLFRKRSPKRVGAKNGGEEGRKETGGTGDLQSSFENNKEKKRG